MDEERFRQANVVRLWAVHHDGELVWRASAENAHTGERPFAEMKGLCEFSLHDAATLLGGCEMQ